MSLANVNLSKFKKSSFKLFSVKTVFVFLTLVFCSCVEAVAFFVCFGKSSLVPEARDIAIFIIISLMSFCLFMISLFYQKGDFDMK